jgi:hypothetical protein
MSGHLHVQASCFRTERAVENVWTPGPAWTLWIKDESLARAGYDSVDWIKLAQDNLWWDAFVKITINARVS